MKTSSFFRYRDELNNGVSIARKAPARYRYLPEYRPLFPTAVILSRWKGDTGYEKEEYVKDYYRLVLSILDPAKVFAELKGKTLLCWEKPGDFCHRRIVARWIKDNLGITIPEF